MCSSILFDINGNARNGKAKGSLGASGNARVVEVGGIRCSSTCSVRAKSSSEMSELLKCAKGDIDKNDK